MNKFMSLECPEQIMISNVYLQDKGADILVFEHKVIEKSANPVNSLVDKLQEAHKNSTKHISKWGGVNNLLAADSGSEACIPEKSSVSIEILANKSPNNVACEQLLKLITDWKRKSIKLSITFKYMYPHQLDNKYNKNGLKSLNQHGVKIRTVTKQQMVSRSLRDLQEQIESLHNMETCRGVLHVDVCTMRRCMDKLHDGVTCYQEQDGRRQQLSNILESDNNKEKPSENNENFPEATFSLPIYRDYFLLQNSDQICIKLKVSLNKVDKNMQESVLHSKCSFLPVNSKSKNFINKNIMQHQEKKLCEEIWKKIGDKLTVSDIQNEVIVSIQATVSEYPDTNGWHKSFAELHKYVQQRVNDCNLNKIKVRSVLRFATDNRQEGEKPKSEEIKIERMEMQDVLMDMLEDLHDDIKRMKYSDVGVDDQLVCSAMGLLTRSLKCRNCDGKLEQLLV